jgi:hypothetical protein
MAYLLIRLLPGYHPAFLFQDGGCDLDDFVIIGFRLDYSETYPPPTRLSRHQVLDKFGNLCKR